MCGPVCSGKTTTVDLLLESEANLFRISRDKIKRFISDYGEGKYYKKFLDEIQILLVRQAFENNLNVVIEGFPGIYDDMRQKLKKVTTEYKTNFIEINLEASLEVLTDRLNKRIIKAKYQGAKLFCTTEERMLELYDKYMSEKGSTAETIIVDSLTEQEVLEKIKKILHEG